MTDSDPKPEPRARDGWGKADIILKPIIGLLTPVTVILLGFMTTSFLEDRQNIQQSWRLYAELMSKREEADSTLRKDMFDSIINSFVSHSQNEKIKPDEAIKQRVLNLELLAYNFHDALDLGPLFKHLRREILAFTEKHEAGDNTAKDKNIPSVKALDAYRKRLIEVSRDVIDKQVALLRESGESFSGSMDVDVLKKWQQSSDDVDIQNLTVIDKPFEEHQFKVQVLSVYPVTKEALVRLMVYGPDRKSDTTAAAETNGANRRESTPLIKQVDADFRVGFFDFPMIDNTRISGGKRCAVVLRALETEVVDVELVVFPAARASLKEKPYYDEIIERLPSGTAPAKGR